MDLLGELLRATGAMSFPAKGRLIRYWLHHRNTNERRFRSLTKHSVVPCDFAIPYEAMVWLRQEEEKELAVLQRLLLPGQVFVDCGANIGLWSIVASYSLGEKGKVFAFEPNPGTAEKLRRNLSLGNIENVQLFEAAVGDASGQLLLKAEPAHNQARIVAMPDQSTIVVPTITLDCKLSNLKIDACKIDVEGYELNVLVGAQELLRRHKPWLCVEFNTILAGISKLESWPVHQFLSGLGYKARIFTEANRPTEKNILSNNWTTDGYCNLYYSVL